MLKSQVQTILNCRVLPGTLTQVEYVLQECAEFPGANDTGHVSCNETPAEADDVPQGCTEIPGVNHTGQVK